MRAVACTVLPCGEVVTLRGGRAGVLRREEALAQLSRAVCLPPVCFELLGRTDDGMRPLEGESVVACEGVFALVRVRGGGKGGFRKQLAKKGREFSRARAKAEKAERARPRSEGRSHGSPVKASLVERPVGGKGKGVPARVVEFSSAARGLAAQGVAAALRRRQQARHPVAK